MHFQWGKRTCPRRPGKRKYYGLFNISHTSRCTSPQAAFSVCPPACFSHCFITKSLCKSFDLSGDSSRTTMATWLPLLLLLLDVARRRLSPFFAVLFHLSQLCLKCKKSSSGKSGKGGKNLWSARTYSWQTHKEFVTSFLSLERNSKKLEHHQSICDTAWHDIVYFICYTLLTKLVCVNLLQFEGALKETRHRNLLKGKAINNLLLPTFRRLWQTFKQSGVLYM